MSDNVETRSDQQTRRRFITTATYVVPAILTLKASPAAASTGSPRHCCQYNQGDHDYHDYNYGNQSWDLNRLLDWLKDKLKDW
jgi:hypothetical protein